MGRYFLATVRKGSEEKEVLFPVGGGATGHAEQIRKLQREGWEVMKSTTVTKSGSSISGRFLERYSEDPTLRKEQAREFAKDQERVVMVTKDGKTVGVRVSAGVAEKIEKEVIPAQKRQAEKSRSFAYDPTTLIDVREVGKEKPKKKTFIDTKGTQVVSKTENILPSAEKFQREIDIQNLQEARADIFPLTTKYLSDEGLLGFNVVSKTEKLFERNVYTGNIANDIFLERAFRFPAGVVKGTGLGLISLVELPFVTAPRTIKGLIKMSKKYGADVVLDAYREAFVETVKSTPISILEDPFEFAGETVGFLVAGKVLSSVGNRVFSRPSLKSSSVTVGKIESFDAGEYINQNMEALVETRYRRGILPNIFDYKFRTKVRGILALEKEVGAGKGIIELDTFYKNKILKRSVIPELTFEGLESEKVFREFGILDTSGKIKGSRVTGDLYEYQARLSYIDDIFMTGRNIEYLGAKKVTPVQSKSVFRLRSRVKGGDVTFSNYDFIEATLFDELNKASAGLGKSRQMRVKGQLREPEIPPDPFEEISSMSLKSDKTLSELSEKVIFTEIEKTEADITARLNVQGKGVDITAVEWSIPDLALPESSTTARTTRKSFEDIDIMYFSPIDLQSFMEERVASQKISTGSFEKLQEKAIGRIEKQLREMQKDVLQSRGQQRVQLGLQGSIQGFQEKIDLKMRQMLKIESALDIFDISQIINVNVPPPPELDIKLPYFEIEDILLRLGRGSAKNVKVPKQKKAYFPSFYAIEFGISEELDKLEGMVTAGLDIRPIPIKPKKRKKS